MREKFPNGLLCKSAAYHIIAYYKQVDHSMACVSSSKRVKPVGVEKVKCWTTGQQSESTLSMEMCESNEFFLWY